MSSRTIPSGLSFWHYKISTVATVIWIDMKNFHFVTVYKDFFSSIISQSLNSNVSKVLINAEMDNIQDI
jgi:hypothetical protein